MGQRSATASLFGIVSAFVEKREWTQADLARKLETTTETIRKQLGQLQEGGFKLERFEETPQVYWSVPKDWFPGVLPFKQDEAEDLLRLLERAQPSDLRDRLFALVVARLSNLGHTIDAEPDAVHAPATRDEEEKWLAVIEDGAKQSVALKMKYYTASRGHMSTRFVSVHRITRASRPHFIATCHKADALRRFRLSNVSDAELAPNEAFRPATPEAVVRFDDESLGGFRHEGPPVLCAFVVRDPESTWVTHNLPDNRIEHEDAGDAGMRFTITTSAVTMLARFVVGLGGAARAETPELASAVAELARGALANAT